MKSESIGCYCIIPMNFASMISSYFVFLGASVFYNAYFGQGFGPIFLDDLLCTGRETRIIDCPRSTSTGVGDIDFCRGHLDDAGLRCVAGEYQA